MDKIEIRALSGIIEFHDGALVILNGPKKTKDGDIIADGDEKPVAAKLANRLIEEGRAELVDDENVVTHGALPPQAGDAPLFTMIYKPVGKWEISGPGIEPGTIFKGSKDDAQVHIDGLRADYAERQDTGDEDAETGQAGDAPV